MATTTLAAGHEVELGRQGSPGVDTTTRLPVLLIDVDADELVRGTKTPAWMRVIEDHDGSLTDLAQRPVSLETPVGIELRGGDWSLRLDKKGFSLELQDGNGNDRSQSLLGMPPESDYALRAAYPDRTLIRDALAYWMYESVWGRYAPRTRFVELYLGDEYWGVYLLSETVKRDGNRIDTPRVAATAAAGDVTGSYIVYLESDDEEGDRGFVTSTERFWGYRYPNRREITPSQAAYIEEHMTRFELAMAADGLDDPVNGWRRWIDLPSWVDFALFQELARNTDGYTKSSYYTKPPDSVNGGRLAKTTIWDLDLAFGNLNDGTHSTSGWLYEFTSNNVPVPWWERLWGDADFRNAARCRWQELRQGSLTRSAIHAKIDELVASLAAAQPREQMRWELVGKEEAFHAYTGPTYAANVVYLKDWIAGRLEWLDTNLGRGAGC